MADLPRVRWLVWTAVVTTAVSGAAAAHAFGHPASSGGSGFGGAGFNLQRVHNPVGFNLARAEYRLPCGIATLHCRTTDMDGPYSRTWSLELGLQDLGQAGAARWSGSRAQSLNLSLLGRRPVFGLPQLNVYGKVGTSYGFTDAPAPGAPAVHGDAGVGLSYGAGLSMEFTPRLSATLGWDSHDFRMSSGLRDVRATSIGLQYRY